MRMSITAKGWKAGVFGLGIGVCYREPKGKRVIGLMLGWFDVELIW